MNEGIRSIVVGIGEIQQEDPHLAPTVEMADAVGATLHLVHAFPPLDPVLGPHDALEDGTDAAARAETEVASRLQMLTGQGSERSRIVPHAVTGSPSDAMLDVVQQVGADLVVVGASRLGPLASAVLGTTAQRILRASPVPVLVKRRLSRDRPRRILVTTDLSELSEGVHEGGLTIVAALWGAGNITVRSLFVAGDDVLLPRAIGQRFALRDRAEERLRAFLARVVSGGMAVEGRVRLGTSAREILAEADDWSADLLVLGTHGRTGPSRFLIGSVAETVLRRAPCDVLLIPRAAVAVGRAAHEETGG